MRGSMAVASWSCYVPDVRTLRLYSRPEAVPADLADAAESAGDPSTLTGDGPARAAALQELVWAAAEQPAAGGAAALLGPLGEVLLLDALAATAEGPLRGMATTAGFRRALGRAFQGAAGVDMKPATLLALARRLGKGESASTPSAARVAEVARLYRLYREHLGPRRLDAALFWHRGLGALDELPLLAAVDVVELHGLHRAAPWDAVPTPHGLMQTIDALAQSGRRVRVVLPQVDERPLLVQALAPLYDALFRKHELDVEEVHVPLGPEVAGDGPWARFLRGLFQKTGAPPLVAPGELGESQLGCTPLPSPRAEAQKVAQKVRDLLDAGVAPGEIAVVAPGAQRRAGLVAALSRYGVPVYAPPALSGESRQSVLPPPLQALLGLFDTLLQGLPREGLIQAMTSGYFRFPGPLQKRPWQVARALRAAGVRDLRPPGGAALADDERWATGTQGTLGLPRRPAPTAATAPADYRQRLEQWLRQQAAQQRPSKTSTGETAPAPAPNPTAPLPESLLAVARQVDAVVHELMTLPEAATLSEHCTALRRLTERLQFAEHALLLGPEATPLAAADLADPSQPADEDDGSDAAAILAEQCLALARDQAALTALGQVLDELPRLARRLRLQTQPVSQTRFAALLRAALLRLLPPAGPVGCPGAGVLVGELGQLGNQRWSQLFITGLVDGELPQRTPEDAVLDDDDRRALNRLCDAPLWPLAQQEGERTPLLLAEALAHSRAAHLSWPTADEEGRPLLRSPLVDAVLQAAARSEPTRLRVPLLPWPDEARHRTELWARAVLQRSLADEKVVPGALVLGSEPAPRYGADAPLVRLCTPTLLGALGEYDRDRAARLRARIAVEQLRSRWFAGLGAAVAPPVLDALAGPFVGHLSPGAAIERLQPKLPGSAQKPLSASALEDYAKCPFRFFVRRVLKAAPLTESGEDLDPLAGGRLQHSVLERFFLDRRDAGRLPLRGDHDDHAAMDKAIDDELRKFRLSERTGHPELLKVRVRRLRADLQRLLTREASSPIDPGCVPARFEHHFGPLAIRSVSGEGDEAGDTGPGTSGALHIEGIIDRVDLGPGRAVVLDYKAGRLGRYQDLLNSHLLSTSFQLPLYAAALTVDESLREGGPPLTEVSARYYSLRQGQVSRPLHDAEMISLDPEVRRRVPDHNVAEVAYRLWRRLRAGDFRVAPRTCEGCGLEATCRIPAAPSALAEAAAESLDGTADSSTSTRRTPPPSLATPTREFTAEPERSRTARERR